MLRPVNRSSSGHQSSKSKVLLRYWDPNIYNYIPYKIWYRIKYIIIQAGEVYGIFIWAYLGIRPCFKHRRYFIQYQISYCI